MAAESDPHGKYGHLPPAVRIDETSTSQETRLAVEPTPVPNPNDEDFVPFRLPSE